MRLLHSLTTMPLRLHVGFPSGSLSVDPIDQSVRV